jgi:hypothetical protein
VLPQDEPDTSDGWFGAAASWLDSAAMPDHEMRVSDMERDTVARHLRDHWAIGRLSIDELDERLGRVYAAVTRREMQALLCDLPAHEHDAAANRHPRRFFWPGMAPFNEKRRLATTCRDSYDTALRQIVPRMGTQGYHLEEEIRPRRLRFVSDSGLFITVMFHPSRDGGTDVSAFGHGPRAIRKAFATLSD